MDYDDRHLAGIGGWLAFFLISIGILRPLSLVASVRGQLYADPRLAGFYGDQWWLVEGGEWLIVAASIGGLWFMAWRLTKVENWTSVRIAVAGLWLVDFGGRLLELLLVGSTGRVAAARLGEVIAPQLVGPLIIDTLWTAYLLRSRRVANSYPRQGSPDEVAEIFS
jgi:hypothetical protein